MFIQTETTSNPAALKFLPGRQVLPSGTAEFGNAESAIRSPLAQMLLQIDGVTSVSFDTASITAKKDDDKTWQFLKPAILGVIMEHFTAGKAVLLDDEAVEATDASGNDGRIIAEVKELIETRIRPTATQSGGDVSFHSYDDGIVYLEMQGSASSLRDGILNMLQHYIPEVVAVRDHRDAIPKPGLNTPEGVAIQKLLEERINPAVAAHGGHISLVDVMGDTIYIRLEGGCQGCGMADVTLKQGIEVEIKQVVPSIKTVLDTTDHAGGQNPYYEPGKSGVSPI